MFNDGIVVTIMQDDNHLSDSNGIVGIRIGSEYQIHIKNTTHEDAVSSIFVDGQTALDFDVLVRANDSVILKGKDIGGEMYAFKVAANSSKVKNHRGSTAEDGTVRVIAKFIENPPIREALKRMASDANNVIRGGISRNFITTDNSDAHTWAESSTALYSSSISNVSSSTLPASTQSNQVEKDVITVKGAKVSQHFTPTTVGAYSGNVATVVLKLRGTDNRINLTSSKVKCEFCGTKNKSSNNFCSECGNNLG
jgi:hypothetical protein